MSYSVQNIRNVCLLGHSGSGKTALAESLIYITGAIDWDGFQAAVSTWESQGGTAVKEEVNEQYQSITG